LRVVPLEPDPVRPTRRSPAAPSSIVALVLGFASAASGAAGATREPGGLAGLREPRYVRVDEVQDSLDGVHRHRIPTLVCEDPVDRARTIVAVYEQTGQSEELVGTEEADSVSVERIVSLGPRRLRHLVLRVGAGRCLGCSWLAIYRVQGRRLVPAVPARTVHELADVDGDGQPEALAVATRLAGFAGLAPEHSPRVEQVWAFRGGRFVEVDREYGRHHWRRLMQLLRELDRPAPADRPGQRDVGLAVSLYFEHEILSRPDDGLVIASRTLERVIRNADPVSASSAERALEALRRRVERHQRARSGAGVARPPGGRARPPPARR
jgi:hypothetical protein